MRRSLAALGAAAAVVAGCGGGHDAATTTTTRSARAAPARPPAGPAGGARARGGGDPVQAHVAFAAVRPGRIPPPLRRHDVYAAEAPGLMSARARGARALVYVPNSGSSTVSVISQRTRRVVRTFAVGRLPQHVTPVVGPADAVGRRTTVGNTLTPIDPRTGRRRAAASRVRDPYNLYFTADGRRAIVVAEAQRQLDFRDAAHDARCGTALPVPSARASTTWTSPPTAAARSSSCEFAGPDGRGRPRPRARRCRSIDLPDRARCRRTSSSPRTDATFYVADMHRPGSG